MAMATEPVERGAATHPDIKSYGAVNTDILAMLSRPENGGGSSLGSP
jgi:hypothetical protein